MMDDRTRKRYNPPKTARAWLALFQLANGHAPTLEEFKHEMTQFEDTTERTEEWYTLRRELLKAVGLPEDSA